MIEIRRILVPCDFSDFSTRALDHAIALARWYDAELAALHVMPLLSSIETLPVAAGPVPTQPVAREAVRGELDAFLERARSQGIRTDAVVAEGTPVDQILRQSGELPADLVVMGTHGRSGFERWVLGSVTEKVLRKAKCPVLTVPRDTMEPPSAGRPPFATILCPIDFSPSSLRGLEYAMSLAREGCARITLLHSVESLPEVRHEPKGFDLEAYRAGLEEELKGKLRAAVPVDARDWCRPQTQLAEGKPYEQILRMAGEQKTELIVMGVQGRNALDLMLFGSNTSHVIRGASCPVLTIRTG